MRLLTTADLQLWDRCRRQWMQACLLKQKTTENGQGPDPVPQDMIGLVSIREYARVAAVARNLLASDCEDLTPEEARTQAVPAPAWILRTGRNTHGIHAWNLRTREALSAGTSFINGALSADGFVAGVDCGRFHRRMNSWDFLLFRPATGVRGAFEEEAAVLLGLCRAAGVAVNEIRIIYLEKSARHPGDHDGAGVSEEHWKRLFRESNVTGRAGRAWESVRKRMDSLRAVASGESELPREYRCGRNCRFCGSEHDKRVAKPFDVLTLHKGRHVGRELVSQGVFDIRDIDLETRSFTERQRIQVQAVRSGRPHVDRDRLSRFLAELEWPLAFLDFEAYSQSIPPAEFLAPYEHIPVVASVHRQERPGGDAVGTVFVADPGHDQRQEMFTWLCSTVAGAGTVVVYSLPFESAMVRQLARCSGEETKGEELVRRMVDLLKPFNEFMVYHPDQCGKVSLKRVLPIYTVSDYDSVSVRDGLDANLSYTRLADRFVAAFDETVMGAGARAAEEATVYLATDEPASLEEISRYCAQDTLALVELVNQLPRLPGDALQG
jgi:hypothetical protein